MVGVKISLDGHRDEYTVTFALEYGSRIAIHESREDEVALDSARPLLSLTRLCHDQKDDFAAQHESVRIHLSAS
jgi:hypothetical protein